MAQSAAAGFRLRLGETAAPADVAPEALAAFVAKANDARRIAGLPDSLNPGLIDPGKAARFVAALPRLPASTLARLAGHDLLLDDAALRIQVASPTRAESFDQPFTLTIEDVQGQIVLAGTSVPIDVDLARTGAAQARDAAKRLDQEAKREERAGPGAAATAAKERRLAAAQVWRMNAAAWAEAAAGDAAAAASLREATQAVRSFRMAPRDGTISG